MKAKSTTADKVANFIAASMSGAVTLAAILFLLGLI